MNFILIEVRIKYYALFTFSLGKITFFDKLIAREFFSPDFISMRCLEQHTKSPKKSYLSNLCNKHFKLITMENSVKKINNLKSFASTSIYTQ